jgi:hypothetical protein
MRNVMKFLYSTPFDTPVIPTRRVAPLTDTQTLSARQLEQHHQHQQCVQQSDTR